MNLDPKLRGLDLNSGGTVGWRRKADASTGEGTNFWGASADTASLGGDAIDHALWKGVLDNVGTEAPAGMMRNPNAGEPMEPEFIPLPGRTTTIPNPSAGEPMEPDFVSVPDNGKYPYERSFQPGGPGVETPMGLIQGESPSAPPGPPNVGTVHLDRGELRVERGTEQVTKGSIQERGPQPGMIPNPNAGEPYEPDFIFANPPRLMEPNGRAGDPYERDLLGDFGAPEQPQGLRWEMGPIAKAMMDQPGALFIFDDPPMPSVEMLNRLNALIDREPSAFGPQFDSVVDQVRANADFGENSLIVGGTGSGKLTMAREFAKETPDSTTLSMHAAQDPFDMVGQYTLKAGGGFGWEPSSLAATASSGGVVVLDGLDEAPASVQRFLGQLLQDRECPSRIGDLDLLAEQRFTVHPDTRFVATARPESVGNLDPDLAAALRRIDLDR